MEGQGALSAVLLSTRAADRAHVVTAGVAIFVMVALCAAIVPFAGTPLPRSDLFLPIYQPSLAMCDAVTASLLFSRSMVWNSARLRVLGAGYVFSAAMAVFHLASFPGLFAPSGLLGAGPQTTAWLYFLWRFGFAVTILVYASMRDDEAVEVADATGSRLRIVLAATAGVVVAVALVVATTAGHDSLPRIMSGDDDLHAKYAVAVVTWLVTAGALAAVLRPGRRTVLNVWLAVVVVAWLCDIALASVFNSGRFSVGWYAGRIYGLLASGLLLVVYLAQEAQVHRTLAEALSSEHRQRLLIEEGAGRLARSEAEARSALVEVRRLSAARLGAREEERRRLARDLHDDLGQALLALKIELSSLHGQADPSAANRSRIESMLEILDAAVESISRIVNDLRPPALDDLGFASGLESLVEEFGRRFGVRCSLTLKPPGFEVDEPAASELFRIVQEALTNAVRHGEASRVDVALARTDREIRATVRDDGRGFDAAAPITPDSHGIAGMRERAQLLSGSLAIGSTPGGGTFIEVTVPVDPAASRARTDEHGGLAA